MPVNVNTLLVLGKSVTEAKDIIIKLAPASIAAKASDTTFATSVVKLSRERSSVELIQV